MTMIWSALRRAIGRCDTAKTDPWNRVNTPGRRRRAGRTSSASHLTGLRSLHGRDLGSGEMDRVLLGGRWHCIARGWSRPLRIASRRLTARVVTAPTGWGFHEGAWPGLGWYRLSGARRDAGIYPEARRAVVFEGADTVEFEFADGTRAQLTRSTGSKAVVPLFEVEGDISEARQELIDAGLPVDDIGDDGAWQWCVVDGPDGQRFEIGRRR